MFGTEIGVDLGTSSILIYLKGKGIVLQEPSIVAIDTRDNKVIAIGESARRMFEKAPPYINIVRPLRDGTISDYKITEIMLKYFISKAIVKNSIRKPKVIVCVPCEITPVEKKAVEDSVKDAGARQVFIIEEPIAAAIGAELDISKPIGHMIIDIGAGTTDIAVISLGQTVVGTSLKIAGDKLDEDIVNFIRKKHNLVIGIKTAENIKKNIGCACKTDKSYEMAVKGQNIVTHLPDVINISSNEVFEAIEESINSIIQGILSVLEKTPPELSSDILEVGITMTGGGALLNMLDIAIKEKTGVSTYLAEDTINAVALGAGKYIKYATKDVTKLKKFKF